MSSARIFRIDELRPNNWYVNRAKLDRVRAAWAAGEQSSLPPVLVTQIDGELSLIDGHARTLGAHEAGAIAVLGEYDPLEEIEGSTALYEHIHRRGRELGIRNIGDLASRVVDPEEHERLWIGYCEAWLAEHRPRDDA